MLFYYVFCLLLALNCLLRNAPFVIHLSTEMLQFNSHFALHTATDQWPLQPVAISNPFLAIYSFLFMQTLITIQTSSPFLFYYVSTRSNKQGILLAPVGGTPLGARVIYQQSVCSHWSISVVTPTLEPHCQPANQAELPIGKSLEKVATVQNLAGVTRTHGNHSHSGHW